MAAVYSVRKIRVAIAIWLIRYQLRRSLPGAGGLSQLCRLSDKVDELYERQEEWTAKAMLKLPIWVTSLLTVRSKSMPIILAY